jgi:hypothetical protein
MAENQKATLRDKQILGDEKIHVKMMQEQVYFLFLMVQGRILACSALVIIIDIY